MSRTRRLLVAGAAAAWLSACAYSTDSNTHTTVGILARDTSALFQTDSLRYTLHEGDAGLHGEIGVTFTNKRSQTAYIVNCNGATDLRLEKLVADAWVEVWAPVVPDCLSPPVSAPAGRTVSMVIPIVAGHAGSDTHPQFTVTEIAGIYRVVWHDLVHNYQTDFPFGDQLPLTARVSNRFILIVAP